MSVARLILSLLLFIYLSETCGAAAVYYEFPEQWKSWKTVHGKNYLSDLEDLDRHLVWLSNKKYIESHNANEDYFGFGLAMNSFGDLVCSLLLFGVALARHRCALKKDFNERSSYKIGHCNSVFKIIIVLTIFFSRLKRSI